QRDGSAGPAGGNLSGPAAPVEARRLRLHRRHHLPRGLAGAPETRKRSLPAAPNGGRIVFSTSISWIDPLILSFSLEGRRNAVAGYRILKPSPLEGEGWVRGRLHQARYLSFSLSSVFRICLGPRYRPTAAP